jgi:hypothetical protein
MHFLPIHQNFLIENLKEPIPILFLYDINIMFNIQHCMSATSDRKKDSEKNMSNAAQGTSDITNVGDASRDITDTGDVARASIAKGKGIQEDVTAADITRGKTPHGAVTQGVTQTGSGGINSREATDTEDVSKVIGSGTSLTKSESIDKTDIYSTSDDGTRDMKRAQEKPVKKVEDKEKGTWKIKED